MGDTDLYCLGKVPDGALPSGEAYFRSSKTRRIQAVQARRRIINDVYLDGVQEDYSLISSPERTAWLKHRLGITHAVKSARPEARGAD